MSYALGYLGAEGVIEGAPRETADETAWRSQARTNAINIWNDYRRLLRQGPVRELMATEPYEQGAFTHAYRRLRSAVAARSSSIRVSTREFASLIQAAMAKISVLQIKARMLSRAINIRTAYPIAERVNNAARALLTAVSRMLDEARPLRKQATSGMKGLGFIMAVALIGAFVIVPVLMILYAESMTNAAGADADADAYCRREAQAGRSCSGAQWQEARATALEVRAQSGVAPLLREAGSGAERMWEDTTHSEAAAGLGRGLTIALTVGAVGALGLVTYAAWPYLTGVRGVGKRFARMAAPKEEA